LDFSMRFFDLLVPLALAALLSAPSSASLNDAKVSLLSDIVEATDSGALAASLRSALAKLESVGAEDTKRVAVIGGGLAGLTSSLWLLENGYAVDLVDRSDFLGGNSAKASSGINGAYTNYQLENDLADSSERFYNDTLKSSNREDDDFTRSLIETMVGDSSRAVEWILDRAKIPKPILVGQMGGHSASRTHRPAEGLAGAAFISGLEKAASAYKKTGQLSVKTATRVTGIEREGEAGLWRLSLESTRTNVTASLVTPAVIICTGGFGNDKGQDSLLKEVAPNLLNLASTNGDFTTGDGIKMARKLGAGTVDMDMVQVHPTGFSDVPKGFEVVDEASRTLILCAEVIRGAGAILLDKGGSRFIDELETRKTVTEAMNAKGEGRYVIAVPPKAAETVSTHMKIYSGKELLVPVEGAAGVAEYIANRHSTSKAAVLKAVKKTFESPTANVPRKNPTELPSEGTYYVGLVQPVLHYTMGGLAVDSDGHVLDDGGEKNRRPPGGR